jgi:hypothetical protein
MHVDADSQENTTSTADSVPNVNVFDYQVSSFDEAGGPSQEMQERGGHAQLGQSSTVRPVQYPSDNNPIWGNQ